MNKILVTSILLLAPLSIFANAPKHDPDGFPPVLFKVGSDAACNYATIFDAMNAAGSNQNLVIRVAKNIVPQSVNFTAREQLTIEGGYDNCSDTTASGRSTINGTGFAGSVLDISAGYFNGVDYNVILRNLEIRGGAVTTAVPARGGGLTIKGPIVVSLDNTLIRNNSSIKGGGVYILGEAGRAGSNERTQLSLYGNSSISDNDAARGGGIGCDEKANVRVYDAAVRDNQVTELGGGIYSRGCHITVFEQKTGLLQGVIFNTAAGFSSNGGGIHATLSSVNLQGGRTGPAKVSANQAGSGGGVYISQDSSLSAYNADISFNTAIKRGGGVYASNSSTIISRTLPGAGCHDETRCSRVSDNHSTGLHTDANAGGGALFVFGGSTRISGTFIERNRADSSRGMAIQVLNAPGTNPAIFNGFRLLGSVVANNNNGGIEVYEDGSIIEMRDTSGAVGFTTFTGNRSSVRVILTPTDGPTTYDVNVYGTIFNQNQTYAGPAFGGPGAVPSGDCNQFDAIFDAFSIASLRSTTASPQFVDAANQDYRLGGTNLVDWCDASFNVLSSLLSADGGPRPYDFPLAPVYGNYDLGGLERHPTDLIFRNGFN